MDVFKERSISDAKQNLPSIIREASRGYETITSNFKSEKSKKISIISTELLEEILREGYKFEPVIEEDEKGNGFTIALDALLIHGEGDTLYAALLDLAENLLDYSADYLKRIDLYRQIENRRSHYPYLRRIAGCVGIDQVMEVITECHMPLRQVISKRSQKD